VNTISTPSRNRYFSTGVSTRQPNSSTGALDTDPDPE
jgi:hypothetical protein